MSESSSVVAIVAGQPFTETLADLFIPPDALEVLLDSFSGPLDLLLYLIRRQNIDILDIPIALISQQYLHYIQILEQHRLELAADYLVMAALLAEIKSRLLLPVSSTQQEEVEEDPRMILVRKLQIYEQFKLAAVELDALPRCERDVFRVSLIRELPTRLIPHPNVELSDLMDAMTDLMKRQSHLIHHRVAKEPLSVRERMAKVLEKLHQTKTMTFSQLIATQEGRLGLSVTFLAVLELAKLSLLLMNQSVCFSPIYLQVIENE